MHGTERELVRAVGRGEPGAAAELVDRFYAALYAFLRRLTGNDADAADLTQRTFTRVWAALPRFAGRSSLSSWLHGIGYHVYQDWRRANHRLESRPDTWWEAQPDPRPEPAAAATESDLAATLYAAVEQLEPGVRETVHLHYYQGLTLAETAEVLGIAMSTVKYRLRHALQDLQTQVSEAPRPPVTLAIDRRP